MRAKTQTLGGWGRWPTSTASVFRPERLAELQRAVADAPSVLARGAGRSYGDQALNQSGSLVLTTRLNRLLGFDPTTGLLVAEPGVTFRDVLATFQPRGWRLPVSPGTGFATLGGAIANDVHGKNHDGRGSFSDHVQWFDLLLASGEVRRVVRGDALFRATVGGMGLTGVIIALAVTLDRVTGNAVLLKEQRITDLDHFLSALQAARASSYSVGWIDALARGRALGRGLLETAEPTDTTLPPERERRRRVPLDFPGFALSAPMVRAFNLAYRWRVPTAGRERLAPVAKFLYPLDAIEDWNRIYGKRGFHQFQCVVPDAEAPRALTAMLQAIADAGAASFLAVLKTLGPRGQGMLSFPQPGFTLALDFPHRATTGELLARLERLTLDAGGRLYLAKDSVASPASIAAMYPDLPAFQAVLAEVDPAGRFTSDMARRLGVRGGEARR
ncbi:MAG: FAD-binding oxidoreductase [Alphaproteobacteria bacterium]|nr:MAG: FAD-binding oxidoreductase [Alphaproteobacteria bacterium]